MSSADRAPTGPNFSGWAMVSLLCSMGVFCPFLTLLGPLLAVRALVDIKAHPGKGGRTIALTAVWLGLGLTLVWVILLYWWSQHARPVMIHGPQEALRAADAGDLAAFKSSFRGEGASATDAQAAAFINELTSRYGGFISSSQKPDAKAADKPQGEWGARVLYILQFDRESVDALVQIVPFADGLAPRFGFIVIRDPVRGDLFYPSSTQEQLEREQAAKWPAPSTPGNLPGNSPTPGTAIPEFPGVPETQPSPANSAAEPPDTPDTSDAP